VVNLSPSPLILLSMSNFINLVVGGEVLAAVAVPPAVEVADVGDVTHVKITTSSSRITAKIIAALTSGGGGSSDISVQRIKLLSQSAIYVEPPVTDEVLLVEEGAVGTEEAVLDQPGVAVVGADVECLAV